MNNRIALVLKAKNISPTVLADDLGVQRSGISHILNGRNKPSLEFIQKLIKLYPDISIQWILFGEGPMMNPYLLPDTDVKSVQSTPVSAEKPKMLMMELFDSADDKGSDEVSSKGDMGIQNDIESANNQIDTSSEREIDFQSGKKELIEKEEKPQIAPAKIEIHQKRPEVFRSEEVPSNEKNKKPDKQPMPDRKITKIVVFYNDRTFIEYSPGEEPD